MNINCQGLGRWKLVQAELMVFNSVTALALMLQLQKAVGWWRQINSVVYSGGGAASLRARRPLCVFARTWSGGWARVGGGSEPLNSDSFCQSGQINSVILNK